jgi:signal transduction histidine kinase/CheY-like chemotaxis protein
MPDRAAVTRATLDHRQLLAALEAFRKGDFSARLPTGPTGIDGAITETFNQIVLLCECHTGELRRLAETVGKLGKTRHRAHLPNASGSWAESIDAVNGLVRDLLWPTAEMARVIEAVARGNLSQKMDISIDSRELCGDFLHLREVVNTMVDQLNSFASEVTRVAREVGTEGKLGGQASVQGVAGTWKDLTDNVNLMAANLTAQVRNIAEVTTAVANGDLSRKITVEVRGEILDLKNTINTMVDQLNSFAFELARVAHEVGTEGKLGGQARVVGVAGIWMDLTDNVNLMTENLTRQVRNIADVTTSVARGDLSKKITVAVKGEILDLKNTINTMVDQLNSFASEVTRVAREVGTEGKLGGQARVPGADGLWREMTENVNQLAANLTTQVRAIADVSDAVSKGDLTRSITVEASGEVAALKNNINQLIRNLVQAKKMEAVGQLTGGIAHDFNNLLTVILGNIDLLMRRIDNDRLQRQFSAIRHAAERGQALTRQLLAFSRRQHLHPQTLDVNMLVRQFEPLIGRAVGESIGLEIAQSDKALVCEVDPSELEAALLNLAVNARDAMPKGGTLRIALKYIERDDSLVSQHGASSSGPWNEISVEDNGTGMPKDVLDRVFEPFFTTKEIGKGSGLGLSRVYGFVRQSGGFVTLASRVGVGTRLSIYLPPSAKPIEMLHTLDEVREISAARTGTVLVVEDEATVLALVIEIFNDLGFRVITASDAHGALEIIRRGEPIDLLFTDIVMPGGKTGVELAVEARDFLPNVKILLTSGYPGEALAHHCCVETEWPMISKPFRQSELAVHLQHIFGG